MIRIVAIGLICLAGVGAIAAAASRSTSIATSAVDYPIVARNKSDRLPMVSLKDIRLSAEKVSVSYTPPAETPLPAASQPRELAKPRAPDFVPRHWHDPNDTRAKGAKPKLEPSKEVRRSPSSRGVVPGSVEFLKRSALPTLSR